MANQLEPEFEPHFTAWKQAPTPANTGSLLKAVSPVLDTAIKSYAGGNRSPTLRGRAKQLAIGSFGTYDPSRGTLKTHLLSQLQGLRRAQAREENVISAPEAVRLDFGNLRSQEKELEDQLGRPPSDAEISDATGLSHKRLAYIRHYQGAVPEGMLERDRGEGDNAQMPEVEQLHGNPEEAWQDFIYHDLGPVDKTIFDLALGRNGRQPMSVKEIAQRLGISPSAVSQRTAKIQQILDSRHDVGSIL